MADMPQLIVHDLFELALFKNSASHHQSALTVIIIAILQSI
jgi:hypothetical protein